MLALRWLLIVYLEVVSLHVAISLLRERRRRTQLRADIALVVVGGPPILLFTEGPLLPAGSKFSFRARARHR